MRLKRVRIFGFKTFAQKTEFSLDGGFVAVVGPNGCGKSNLVDAILWGLGEGSTRLLRAGSSQEVIFSGSKHRKPVGYCEVTLLFENEDRALPIDQDEVAISRRLTRSGESEYRINRQTCRLKDIHDLLADSGLGRSGYSIVGQREIDAALSASAEERRDWVDEAAGVQRYRLRKQDSLRRLTAAQDHLTRVDDILRELDVQREPLREEAEQARRYKELQAALRSVEVGLLIRDYSEASQAAWDFERTVEESRSTARKELERARDLEESIRLRGEEISAIEQEMDDVRALQHRSLTSMERADAEARLCDQKLENLNQLERNLLADGDDAKRRSEEALRDLEIATAEEAAERQNIVKAQAEGEDTQRTAGQIVLQLQSVERELQQARQIETRRVRQEADRHQRKERVALLVRELADLARTRPDLIQAIEEARKQESHQVLAQEALVERRKSLKEAAKALLADEDQAAQRLRQVAGERASLEGKRLGLEATLESFEGLPQGTKSVLEAMRAGQLKASYRPVGECIEVDKEHALAIETALGAMAFDLVVEHEKDAKAAIEWLKEHRAGRATFQPLNLLRTQAVPDLRDVVGRKGVVGRASELVEAPAEVRPVVENLLGRVVIVETLDDALHLARTHGWNRMITLEGEVVHSSGAVAGGRSAKTGYGLVQRRADLEQVIAELGNLDRAIQRGEMEAAKRRQEIDAIRAEISVLEQPIAAAIKEREEASAFRQTLEMELRESERSITKVDLERERLLAHHDETLPSVDIAGLESKRDEILKEAAGRESEADLLRIRVQEARERLRLSQSRLDAARRRSTAAGEASEQRLKRLAAVEPERRRVLAEQNRHRTEQTRALTQKQDSERRLADLSTARRELLEANLLISEEVKSSRETVSALSDATRSAEIERARNDSKRAAALVRLVEEYGMDEDEVAESDEWKLVPSDAQSVVQRLRRDIRALGDVNLGAIEAFHRVSSRWEELSAQHADVLEGIGQIRQGIDHLDSLTRERFEKTFDQVRVEFEKIFLRLFGGGEATIRLTNPESPLDSGIEVEVTLPGKRKQAVQLLSGGERALCAAAFLFALLRVKPSPLVVLDEIDAPLDGRNVERFSEVLAEFSQEIQFVVITHNPTTIATAPIWLGVTMQEPGVSSLAPARLGDEKRTVAASADLEPPLSLALVSTPLPKPVKQA